MYRSLIRTLALVVALVAWAGFAGAETLTNETFNTQLQAPEGWTEVSGGERTAFSLRHEESQSQIEVLGTRLLTPDVADVFFEVFHTALRGSEFLNPTEEERTYGDHTGKETRYTFQHSGVELKVSVFEFVRGDLAWIVVSYIESDVADEYTPAVREVIASLRSVD